MNRYLLPSFFIALFLHFTLAFTDPGIFKTRPAIPKKRSHKVIAIDLVKPAKAPQPAQIKKTVSIKEDTTITEEPKKKVIKKVEERPKLEKIPKTTVKKKKMKTPVQEQVIKKVMPPKVEKKPVQEMEPDALSPESNEMLEEKDIVLPKDLSSRTKTIQPAEESSDQINQPEDSLPHTPVLPIIKAVPRYKKNRPPAYPELARKRGYQGTVVLEVLVKKDGHAGTIRLEESSGYKLLDQAAIHAAKEWLFSPGKEEDELVEMWVKIPVRFRLK